MKRIEAARGFIERHSRSIVLATSLATTAGLGVATVDELSRFGNLAADPAQGSLAGENERANRMHGSFDASWYLMISTILSTSVATGAAIEVFSAKTNLRK
jgi:hypothetical protein